MKSFFHFIPAGIPSLYTLYNVVHVPPQEKNVTTDGFIVMIKSIKILLTAVQLKNLWYLKHNHSANNICFIPMIFSPYTHTHLSLICSFHLCLQPFSAFFEASLEGVPQNQAKGRNLTFEVCGEGNLPRIKVMKPSVINKKGQALLLFKRNLVGRSQTMPLILINDGTLPSKVR